jgi:OOP family OmpA-OmpF porin
LNFINSSATKTVLGDKEDIKVYFYHIDGLYHFLPEQQFVPFLAAGIGGLAFDREHEGTDNDYALNYGVGFKVFPVDQIALRGDFRQVISRGEDFSGDNEYYMSYIASLGLAFQFGGVKAIPPDGDADGDGVKDSMDKCPGTPPGSIVNAQGCVADSDMDGVIDAMDKCPDTPRGIKVDETGCPIVPPVGDGDGDGVKDDIDECPDTPPGVTVTAKGCWVIKDLLFDFGKYTIRPENKDRLDKVVAKLKENPSMNVEIQGHTDNVGSLKYNETLSKNRAMAIKNYLVAEGIDASRLSASGYAFTRPVASNDTDEGRQLNRRVELHPVK